MGPLRWTLVVLVVVLALSALGAWLYARHVGARLTQSAPAISGEFVITGAQGAIVIARDQRGVPHIFAQTESDVYFGLGFAHAQDRYHQMDITRRRVTGRLASLLGPGAADSDRRARALGYGRLADDMAARLDGAARVAGEAYVAGVNAALASEAFATPPEYAVLMAGPEPWTLADTAAVWIGLAEAWSIGGLVQDETELAVRGVLSEAQAASFLDDEAGGVDGATGGYAWALSGERTDARRPMIGGGLDGSFASPGLWYAARLALPSGSAAGVGAPGLPFLIQARTERTAWALAPNGADTMDLIVAPEGEARAFEDERIGVRFWLGDRVTPRATALGPVVAGFDDAPDAPDGFVAVMRTTLDDDDLEPFGVLYGLQSGAGIDAAREAAGGFVAPAAHLVYAERGLASCDPVSGRSDGGFEGDQIAVLELGRLPERSADGTWLGDGDPANAVLTSAPGDGIALAASTGAASYRSARIQARLARSRLHSTRSLQTLHSDVTSEFAQRMAPVMVAAAPATELGQALKDELLTWDGSLSGGVHAVAFALWLDALPGLVWRDELGEDAFARVRQPRLAFLERVLAGSQAVWCDDVTTDVAETCPDISGAAFDQAGEALLDGFGVDFDTWRWREADHARFDHMVFGQTRFLRDRLHQSVAVTGGIDTVRQVVRTAGEDGYPAMSGTTARFVADLCDAGAAHIALAPGQSGHPASPHAADMLPTWAAGELVELRLDWPQPVRPAGSSLSEWVIENAPPGVNVLSLIP